MFHTFSASYMADRQLVEPSLQLPRCTWNVPVYHGTSTPILNIVDIKYHRSILYVMLLMIDETDFTTHSNEIQFIIQTHNLLHSLPAVLSPISPSTSTHQPSPPLPHSLPAIAALNSFLAYSRTSLSKLPGCNHTAGTPASFASFNNCFVTAGGVITDNEYCEGSDS